MNENRDKKNIFLYTPNLICYIRILLVFMFCFFSFRYQTIAFIVISLSAFLDMVDGYFARKLKQESDLGYFLDMICDRFMESSIIAVLSIVFSDYWILFFLLMMLDLVSHFLYIIHCDRSSTSHKEIKKSENKVLHFYYSNKIVLASSCFFYEAFLLSLYITPLHGYILLLLFPGFLFKVTTNVIQLKHSIVNIAHSKAP